jgi:hypothetical protein
LEVLRVNKVNKDPRVHRVHSEVLRVNKDYRDIRV